MAEPDWEAMWEASQQQLRQAEARARYWHGIYRRLAAIVEEVEADA
jgi:hypothetical protein